MYIDISKLRNSFPEANFSGKLIDRVARSSDASFFQIVPGAVFFPETEQHVQEMFSLARANGWPVTFRAAATSLSGQTMGEGIVADISRFWRGYKINPDGTEIQLQPGVVMDHANLFLQPYGTKLGPDPASGKACMIGGVVANNASGISSGVRRNTYQTMKYIRFLLPSGTVIDTSDEECDQHLKSKEPGIYDELERIRELIRADQDAVEKIRHLFSMKNTVGYSVNAFLDHDRPADILAHLMVGSEGTLGFVSEVTYNTVPDNPYKATVLLGFPDLAEAASNVVNFAGLGAVAVEILDANAIRTVRDLPDMPSIVKKIPDGGSALLIEFHGESEKVLKSQIEAADLLILKAGIKVKTDFVTVEEDRLKLWKARKELFATVGGNRPPGTVIITEDVVVPGNNLVPMVRQLQEKLKRFGYNDAVIFGHAKDASLHFNFSVDFRTDQAKEAFWDFSRELAQLICVDMNGVLKGEHGTGRAVSPFMELQWGEKIFFFMKRIKAVVDPLTILNPGVMFPEEQLYERRMKIASAVDPVVDTCVECGFCEHQCPSRDLTLSPRQRIQVQRYIIDLKSKPDAKALVRQLKKDWIYYGRETCAVDGLCELTCPLKINTGTWVRNLRYEKVGSIAGAMALDTYRHFSSLTKLIRFALVITHLLVKALGADTLEKISSYFNRLSRSIPEWHSYIPGPAGKARKQLSLLDNADMIYFPSCVNRMFENDSTEASPKNIVDSVLKISKRAGLNLSVPVGIENHCCGLAYSSKGYKKAAIKAAEDITEFLFQATDGGRLPVISDTSPCTLQIKSYGDFLSGELLTKWKTLIFLDVVEFLHDDVLPCVTVKPVAEKTTVHPVCSLKRMGLEEKFYDIAALCSTDFYKPPLTGCCASAGDRGMHYPELADAATKTEAALIRESGAEAHYATSRTCEMGMSKSVDKPFESIVFLVEKALNSD